MQDIPALTAEIDRLIRDVGFWNKAILIFMVGVAFVAMGLVVVQQKAFKSAEALAKATTQLDTLKEQELKSQLSKADAKRVELQNRILDIFGPRELTTEQSSRIRNKLKSLRGVKIDVLVIDPGNSFTSSEDSLSFGMSVVKTLRDAHIDAAGWRLESCLSGVMVANVTVIVLGNNDEDREKASKVLEAFRPEFGTYSQLGNEIPKCTEFSDLELHNPNKRGHDARISIAIGTKRQPILTREMLGSIEDKATN